MMAAGVIFIVTKGNCCILVKNAVFIQGLHFVAVGICRIIAAKRKNSYNGSGLRHRRYF